MTLIFGMACADGLLLAADSQSTLRGPASPLRTPARKLYAPWTNLAFGTAGAEPMIQRINESLTRTFPDSDCFTNQTAIEIRLKLAHHIASHIHWIVQNQYYLAWPPPQQQARLVHAGYLFAGYASDGPILLEIRPDLADVDHLERGYAAIGSGGALTNLAIAGLAHFQVRDRELREAKLIAYRMMDDAIRAAAEGIGPPIRMIEIARMGSKNVVARPLSEEDCQVLLDSVATWKELEKETLSESIGLRP